jgi:hypothetical protein
VGASRFRAGCHLTDFINWSCSRLDASRIFDPADQVASSKSFGRDSPDSPFAFLTTGPGLLTFCGVLLLSGRADPFGFFRIVLPF